jgi:hypothetical protein
MRVYAVVEPRVLDFGPAVYVGELRTEGDKPITEHLRGNVQSHIVAPVTVGATEAGVFRVLRERAAKLRLDFTTVEA